MIINLTEIYKGLELWRNERHISAESQKQGYIVNIMEELGELAQAVRGLEYENTHKVAEHEIIDALCDIAVFTINAGADISCDFKPNEIDKLGVFKDFSHLLGAVTEYSFNFNTNGFVAVLRACAILAKSYGFNFELAMLETLREISSRTGAYDESAKKWVKDTSEQAKSKWYKANYELARIIK